MGVDHVLGAELDLIQLGLNPTNWKPMKTVGQASVKFAL